MTGVYQLYTSRKDPHPAYTELSLELEMHLMDNAGYWSPNGLDCEELRISFPFFIPKA